MVSPDGITLFLITEELKSQILQGRVDWAYQPEQLEIILVVRKPGQNLRLLLSAHAENARLHLTSGERKNPPSPPAFCFVLRKYLEEAAWLTFSRPVWIGSSLLPSPVSMRAAVTGMSN